MSDKLSVDREGFKPCNKMDGGLCNDPTHHGPPLTLIGVRADVLLPMLVYLRKFFSKIERTNRNAPSRFIDPEDFEMAIALRGFTPEDFNGLMSLSNSMSAEMKEMLDAQDTPQMSRPERKAAARLAAKEKLAELEAKLKEKMAYGEEDEKDGEKAAKEEPHTDAADRTPR